MPGFLYFWGPLHFAFPVAFPMQCHRLSFHSVKWTKQVKVNLTPQCDGRPPVTSSHKHNFSNNPHSSSQGHSANQRTETRLSIAVLCWSSVPTFSLSNNSPLICQSLHLDNSFPLIFFYFRLRRIFGVQTLLLNAYSTIVQSKYIKQQVVSIYSSAFPIFNFIKWQLSEHNRHSYPPLLDCCMYYFRYNQAI